MLIYIYYAIDKKIFNTSLAPKLNFVGVIPHDSTLNSPAFSSPVVEHTARVTALKSIV